MTALVSAGASSTATDTAHPVVFSGTVTPNHAHERVFLQEQIGSSDDWRTIKSGRIGPGSNYVIGHRFRVPGERDLRVLLPGDFRNIRGESDPVSVTIEQAQVPGFTINTSAPIYRNGYPNLHAVCCKTFLLTPFPQLLFWPSRALLFRRKRSRA